MSIAKRFVERKAQTIDLDDWSRCKVPEWFDITPEQRQQTECWKKPLSGKGHAIYVFPSFQFPPKWDFIIHAGANSEISMSGLGDTKELAMAEAVAYATDTYHEWRVQNPMFKVGDRVAVDSYSTHKDLIGQEGTIQNIVRHPKYRDFLIHTVLFDDGQTVDFEFKSSGSLPELRKI